MKRFVVVSLFVCFLITAGNATVLGDLAASMQPGQWRELNTQGLSKSFLETYGDYCCHHSIVAYCGKAVWNAQEKLFMYHGSPHQNPQKFVIYSDATNSWRSAPAKPIGIHSYYLNSSDPATGDFYLGNHVGGEVYKYSARTNSWSTVAQSCGYCYTYGGLDYFPEANGFFAVGHKGAKFASKISGQWSSLPWSGSTYHYFSVYNPAHKVIFFGGGNGSRAINKLDASLKITSLGGAPIPVGTSNGNVTTDPVSGQYLVYNGGSTFYEYNISTNKWTSTSTLPPASIRHLFPKELAAAPVSTYGVVMYLCYDASNYKDPVVYLYKHSETTSTDALPWMDLSLSLKEIKILPNPFNSRTSIVFSNSLKGADVSIYNLSGKLVKKFERSNGNQITWQPKHLTNGIYLLKVKAGSKLFSTKLLFQK
jgi:hypothetical protein